MIGHASLFVVLLSLCTAALAATLFGFDRVLRRHPRSFAGLGLAAFVVAVFFAILASSAVGGNVGVAVSVSVEIGAVGGWILLRSMRPHPTAPSAAERSRRVPVAKLLGAVYFLVGATVLAARGRTGPAAIQFTIAVGFFELAYLDRKRPALPVAMTILGTTTAVLGASFALGARFTTGGSRVAPSAAGLLILVCGAVMAGTGLRARRPDRRLPAHLAAAVERWPTSDDRGMRRTVAVRLADGRIVEDVVVLPGGYVYRGRKTGRFDASQVAQVIGPT